MVLETPGLLPDKIVLREAPRAFRRRGKKTPRHVSRYRAHLIILCPPVIDENDPRWRLLLPRQYFFSPPFGNIAR